MLLFGHPNCASLGVCAPAVPSRRNAFHSRGARHRPWPHVKQQHPLPPFFPSTLSLLYISCVTLSTMGHCVMDALVRGLVSVPLWESKPGKSPGTATGPNMVASLSGWAGDRDRRVMSGYRDARPPPPAWLTGTVLACCPDLPDLSIFQKKLNIQNFM